MRDSFLFTLVSRFRGEGKQRTMGEECGSAGTMH
jgi:hypothetical protein